MISLQCKFHALNARYYKYILPLKDFKSFFKGGDLDFESRAFDSKRVNANDDANGKDSSCTK